MLQQEVAIRYLDGTSESAVLTQYELGEFDRWAHRHKYYPSAPGRMLIQEMPVLWLRVGAWVAVNRSAPVKVEFDAWNPTVAEVEPIDSEPVGPTQTVIQEEPLPE